MHSTILDKINRDNKPHPLPQSNHEGMWGAKRAILASLKLGERGSTEVEFILSKIAILSLVYAFRRGWGFPQVAWDLSKSCPQFPNKFLENNCCLYLLWYKNMPIVQQK